MTLYGLDNLPYGVFSTAGGPRRIGVRLGSSVLDLSRAEADEQILAGGALRHTDPETGFTHHGFLNVLVGCIYAADGGEVAEVAEALAATHPVPLVEPARARRDGHRPLWVGFGTADVMDPLTELIRLGLVNGGFE